jgi:competence protein ComGC
MKQNEHKRKYNSLGTDVDVTEEQMEAYRLKKGRSDDPMAKVGSDEILEYEQ